ncbi:YesL family protein [Halobacillus halophilus]|uniref:YesL family protein n=1 Tax=Halobacillus halophilus TaxID=1570 RepID=UPI001CD5D180|nr:DUF624 domain-containing protein [Halobacillus halophilus]MCA1010659.1 DUF624 domain-containing protein [Halobacillus halophilus]
MKTNQTFSAIRTSTEFIFTLAYLNILWILFTLMGVVIGGIGPSTAALLEVIDKWQKKEVLQEKMFSLYWRAYKKSFTRANLLLVIQLAVGMILYVDLQFTISMENGMFAALAGVWIFMTVLYIIMLMFSFPLLVHLRLNALQAIKHSFYYAFSSPILTIAAFLSFIGIQIALYYLPSLYLFFSTSLFGFVIMFVSKQIGSRIEKLKNQNHEKKESVDIIGR